MDNLRQGSEEGWFTDPFARHEARWLSDGTPTKLVRDDGVESCDEPPDEPPLREPVRIEDAGDVQSTTPHDLTERETRAAWDAFDQSQP
ncbi:MAG: hypothetical protein ACLP9C_06860 [Acidimicrobiales bacterium]